ncbi:hypothetical protein [Egbenema bharatensis]|uniref:hypothetical protein n=1 Tax=Egbenema bharatensis TaxID=3463334 RepID=UPI003A8BFF0F
MPKISPISSNYHDRLHPWCIICCLPNAQTLIIQRFRRRNDAEAHLRVLQHMNPAIAYEIIFDASSPPAEE